MKTSATLLFLAPAFALASPTQNEIHKLDTRADAPDVNTLGDTVALAMTFLGLMAESYAKGKQCCDQTPCFIGCPISGEPRVGLLEHP
jgi:hypothetical protein